MVDKTIELGGRDVQVTLEDGQAEATVVDAAAQLMHDLNELEFIEAEEATATTFPPRKPESDKPNPEYIANAEELTKEQYEKLIRVIDTREREAEGIDIQRIEPNVARDGLYVAWRSRE